MSPFCQCDAPRVKPTSTSTLTCDGCGHRLPTSRDGTQLRIASALERIADRLEKACRPGSTGPTGPR